MRDIGVPKMKRGHVPSALLLFTMGCAQAHGADAGEVDALDAPMVDAFVPCTPVAVPHASLTITSVAVNGTTSFRTTTPNGLFQPFQNGTVVATLSDGTALSLYGTHLSGGGGPLRPPTATSTGTTVRFHFDPWTAGEALVDAVGGDSTNGNSDTRFDALDPIVLEGERGSTVLTLATFVRVAVQLPSAALLPTFRPPAAPPCAAVPLRATFTLLGGVVADESLFTARFDATSVATIDLASPRP